MDIQGSFADLLRTAEQAASGFFETLTDSVSGMAEPLRDGSEHDPVVLPRDLAAHPNVQTEWWYYTGHLFTGTGRELGFEWVFFKRRTDLDKFSVVPVRLLGNPFYFAHFALTDRSNKTFQYEHLKSANRQLDLPAAASSDHYHLMLGDWSARSAHGNHLLRAAIGRSVIFEASLVPVKDVVLNGVDGVSFKDEGEASRYFSYTRMAIEGDISLDGTVEHFEGTAWMDREFGTWAPTENQKGWDWFSIQFDDGTELMVYQLRNSHDTPSPFSSGRFNDADGVQTELASDEFVIEPKSKWRSDRSGAEYPASWEIRIEKLDMTIEVTPVLPDQELDTRGSTMIVYWEGACRVRGKRGGDSLTGNAYVELVGYDRSHERPDLSRFLLGNYLDYLGL